MHSVSPLDWAWAPQLPTTLCRSCPSVSLRDVFVRVCVMRGASPMMVLICRHATVSVRLRQSHTSKKKEAQPAPLFFPTSLPRGSLASSLDGAMASTMGLQLEGAPFQSQRPHALKAAWSFEPQRNKIRRQAAGNPTVTRPSRALRQGLLHAKMQQPPACVKVGCDACCKELPPVWSQASPSKDGATA